MRPFNVEFIKCLKWSSSPWDPHLCLPTTWSHSHGSTCLAFNMGCMNHNWGLHTWGISTLSPVPSPQTINRLIFFLPYLTLLILCMLCRYLCMCMEVRGQLSEVSSLLQPWDWTQIVRVGGKLLYPLSDSEELLRKADISVYLILYPSLLFIYISWLDLDHNLGQTCWTAYLVCALSEQTK